MAEISEPWWKSAVFYQVYPRSFATSAASARSDSGQDPPSGTLSASASAGSPDVPGASRPAAGGPGTVGDLAGIRQRLHYLRWLGVDALWLSPFFRSPMKDFGYDVADYCDVDPMFGTLADFDALLADAHALGMRVIIDWVPAHTSDEHPWFRDARSSRQSRHRAWYVWRDPHGDGSPPNDWTAAFSPGAPAWTRDATTGQLYLHSFLPSQPDLDWSNPEVETAMHEVLRFWLDRGVDGFRADVIHNIGKDPALADVGPGMATLPHCIQNDHPSTHELLRRIRGVLDEYGSGPTNERMMVGEVYLLDVEKVGTYLGHGDELHLAFNFTPLYTAWNAPDFRDCIDRTMRSLAPRGAWPTWVLSNHDHKRHRTRLGGSLARARAAAVLLMGLRGTPFLYMGEELGLEDAVVPEHRVVDPGGRDGCRAPIPWDESPPHGWAADPWLPLGPEPGAHSMAAQQRDKGSILHLYRRLLAARRASAALTLGAQSWLDTPAGVLGWQRTGQGDHRIVLVNFDAETTHHVTLDGPAEIEVASDGVGEGAPFSGALAPDSAVLLRTAPAERRAG